MKYIFPSLLLLFAGLIFGCKDSSTNTAGTPGDIVGFVQVFDTLIQQLDDNSGVKVSVPGTSYSAISDAAGKWRLSNIPAGTYKLFFSKDGYSSMENFNVVFQGNGTYYYSFDKGKDVGLYKLPNLYPNIVIRPFEDDISVYDTLITDSLGNQYYLSDTVRVKNNTTTFSSRLLYASQNYSIMTSIYFGKTNNIVPADPKTFLFNSDLTYNSFGYDSTGIAEITFHRTDLIKAGFRSGDSIYCCAFSLPTTIMNMTTWVDPETNKNIYSGFSPHHSEVRSFILP